MCRRDVGHVDTSTRRRIDATSRQRIEAWTQGRADVRLHVDIDLSTTLWRRRNIHRNLQASGLYNDDNDYNENEPETKRNETETKQSEAFEFANAEKK